MELAAQRRAAWADVQSSIELLVHQWKDLNQHLDGLILDSQKKGENQIASSNLRDLEAREKEITSKEKEFEVKEKERQEAFEGKKRALERRDLEMFLQGPALSRREDEVRSQQEEIKKRKSELCLEEKKLKDVEEMLQVKTKIFDTKKNRELSGHSAADQGGELGESSGPKRRKQSQPSDCL